MPTGVCENIVDNSCRLGPTRTANFTAPWVAFLLASVLRAMGGTAPKMLCMFSFKKHCFAVNSILKVINIE